MFFFSLVLSMRTRIDHFGLYLVERRKNEIRIVGANLKAYYSIKHCNCNIILLLLGFEIAGVLTEIPQIFPKLAKKRYSNESNAHRMNDS